MPSHALETIDSLIQRPTNYLRRGLRAAAFPLRGIWYFLRRRPFYPLFIGRLLPLSIISFLVYFILFTFAFLPQFAFLAIFHGWGAWINAVVLVLGEGLVITQGLFEAFFVDEIRVDIFDVGLTLLFSPLSRYGDGRRASGVGMLISCVCLYFIGNAHQLRPDRSRRPAPSALPRCAELCQDAREAD